MIDKLRLYISAAPDLRFERDALARSITEIPTSLGFAITQTPPADREPDLAAVTDAHVHVLMIGSDIQAPVGLEWAVARRSGKAVTLLRKSSVQQTQAAHAFMRDAAKFGAWLAFADATALRAHALHAVTDHLVANRARYDMDEDEVARLRDWRKTLSERPKQGVGDARGGADESAVILTTERFVPSEGRLLKPDEKTR